MKNVMLVSMDSLDVLAKIIKTREGSITVTTEWTFSSMLANVTSQMLRPSEGHSAIAVASTLEGFRMFCFGFLGFPVHRHLRRRRVG